MAAPVCVALAARRFAPLVGDALKRSVSFGAPSDHLAGPESAEPESAEQPEPAGEPPAPAGEPPLPSPVPADEVAVPAVEALPIDEYDHLAARQVVARLGGLESAELDAVDAYERSNRHRQTILRRIEQLRT